MHERGGVTAATAGPVWDLTANKKLLIIGPDSVKGTIGWYLETGGHELKSIRSNGSSQFGVKIKSGSNGNNISFNNVSSNGVGIEVCGNNNTLKSGTIGPVKPDVSTGAGVHIASGPPGNPVSGNTVSGMTITGNKGNGALIDGSGNTFTSNKLKSNSPNGVKVTGAGNTVSSNQSDENKGAAPDGDGYKIGGSGTVLKENKGQKNDGDGIELSGTGQKPTKNQPTGTSGSATKPAWHITGKAFDIVLQPGTTVAVDNKANGTSIPSATKCANFFTSSASDTTCSP